MFDFLKKKIGGFIDGLTRKEEKHEARPREAEPPEETAPQPEGERAEELPEAKPAEERLPEAEEAPETVPEATEQPVEEKRKPIAEIKYATQKKEKPAPERKEAPAPRAEKKETPKPAQQPERKQASAQELKPAPQPERKPAAAPAKKPAAPEQPAAIPEPVPQKPAAKPAPPVAAPAKEAQARKPAEAAPGKPRIKLGAVSAIKSFVTREVEIKEGDVKELLENFELELLEADVEISAAEAIRSSLRERLVGARTPKDGLHAFVGSAIRGALEEVMENGRAFDLVERVAACEKPAKIMFLGINGAGKTTTMAKVARLLMDGGMKVVFAASDTFRAAAIEQMAVHADRLGVKMIKRDYGSDPTSVAYDAANYAKAHGMDAVLIDTAGRQDTNISLLNEMKKMNRVIQPDLKIYVGESIAGNAIIEQVSSFNREIGIDAVILTKLDCDPKGGTMLSINRATGIPVIYVGTGQAYGDLEKFDAAKIASRIVD